MAVVAAGWSEYFSALTFALLPPSLVVFAASASASVISNPAALWNPPGICSLLLLPLLPLDTLRKPHSDHGCLLPKYNSGSRSQSSHDCFRQLTLDISPSISLSELQQPF